MPSYIGTSPPIFSVISVPYKAESGLCSGRQPQYKQKGAPGIQGAPGRYNKIRDLDTAV